VGRLPASFGSSEVEPSKQKQEERGMPSLYRHGQHTYIGSIGERLRIFAL